MRIVSAHYGTGNVMFQYAFLCELRKRTNEACCFWINDERFHHNGYELDKIFNIKPYDTLNLFQKIFIKTIRRLVVKRNIGFILIRMFFKKITVDKDLIFYDSIFNLNKGNYFYYGTWQSESYFANAIEDVKEVFTFDESKISDYTLNLKNKILSENNSISIHFRRGDYLNYEELTDCCPLSYYKEAVDLITKKYNDCTFYIFSDDIQYVKDNFNIINATYIDQNKGSDSWQDMFLMSKCAHNIIANSTFSWWGAYLNCNKNKVVIAPKKWWHSIEKEDIVPKEWIRI